MNIQTLKNIIEIMRAANTEESVTIANRAEQELNELMEQNGRFTDWHAEQGKIITDLRNELADTAEVFDQTLDDICNLLKAPKWEYPGQVIRDVKMLVDRAKAVIVAHGDYLFDDRVEDLRHVDAAIDNLAAYLDGKIITINQNDRESDNDK